MKATTWIIGRPAPGLSMLVRGQRPLAAKNNPIFDTAVSKLLCKFKLPGLDLETLADAQPKNVDALTSANLLAAEGMQAAARRHAEILRQTLTRLGAQCAI